MGCLDIVYTGILFLTTVLANDLFTKNDTFKMQVRSFVHSFWGFSVPVTNLPLKTTCGSPAALPVVSHVLKTVSSWLRCEKRLLVDASGPPDLHKNL